MIFLAIDPGSSSGALAFMDANLRHWSLNMPTGVEDLAEALHNIERCPDKYRVTVENVGGSMPGNSACSARTFTAHVGHLQMGFAMTKQPVEWIRPQVWMKDLFGDTLPKAPKGSDAKTKAAAKKARKAHIHSYVKSRFKDNTISLRRADAYAILAWTIKKYGDPV